MADAWDYLPTDVEKEHDYTDMPVDPMPEPPKLVLETKLVDIATEAEKPKNYLNEGEEKKFKETKETPGYMNTPVEIYEPGFRSDMYEAMLKYFKEKKERSRQLDALRNKLGMRR